MDQLILAVPILPILTAVITYLFSDKLRYQGAHLCVLSVLVSFAISIILLLSLLQGSEPTSISLIKEWGILVLDPLSTLMSVVITGISLIVHIYSIRYMADEEGYARFYMLLGLMTSSLLLMVSAGDLITLVIAWHLIGIFLYFLLGQNTASPSSQRYAMWTMITYRLGDFPLIVAAALLYNAYGTWSLQELFKLISQNPAATMIMGMPVTEVSGYLVAFSAFARSAQFLLHNWLPYTMSGPTPVSALMHAGIVNAGGFLINRFAPLYMYTNDVLHLLFIVGLLTAVIGSMLMLTQNDIKKALGYSTMGQMGFMIMECGVGAFSLAVFHLIAHGLFKGTLFLSSGSVISEARHSDGVPKNKLYTFVVEKQVKAHKQPWLIMAAITLLIPLLVISGVHWLVSHEYFEKQGAIVLLFFGWVTGAQLMFASYKMQTTNPWKLFTMILVSFLIVVIGYALISHAFDLFLYPDHESRNLLYEAANVGLVWFDIFVIVITASIIAGWILVYHSENNGKGLRIKLSTWQSFYALLSREMHIIDVYSWFTRRLLLLADKLNTWLRWI